MKEGAGVIISAVSQELKSERHLIRGEKSDFRGATPGPGVVSLHRPQKQKEEEPRAHSSTD